MRIDEELLQKAHDLGLNVTKICENALKEMIRRIESPSAPKEDKGCPEDNNWWGRPDSNRGPERPRLRA